MPADDTRDDLPSVKKNSRLYNILATLVFLGIVAMLFWGAIVLLTGPSF